MAELVYAINQAFSIRNRLVECYRGLEDYFARIFVLPFALIALRFTWPPYLEPRSLASMYYHPWSIMMTDRDFRAPTRDATNTTGMVTKAGSAEDRWTKKAAKDAQEASYRLFKSEEYADLKIQCTGREWNVHRNILGPRCDFFGGCLRSRCQEAHSNVIVLPEDDPDAIESLLEYLYTFGYPHPKPLSTLGHDRTPITSNEDIDPEEEDELVQRDLIRTSFMRDLNIYITAQKYLIYDLRDMARERLLLQISTPPSHMRDPAAQDGQEAYFSLLSAVYSFPDDNDLRSAVPRAISEHWEWMTENLYFQDMLDQNPDLALEIVKTMGQKLGRKEREVRDESCESWNETQANCEEAEVMIRTGGGQALEDVSGNGSKPHTSWPSWGNYY